MRILHVITSLRTGGAEKLMVDLLPLINREAGFHAELCLFDGTDTPFRREAERRGIRIHDFGKGNSVYNPLNIIRLARLIKGFDIVHTHNTSPQFFAAIATVFGRKRLVTTEHNTNNRRREHPAFRPLDRLMYSRYDRIICISDKAAENLSAYLPSIPSGKIRTIYNGVDIRHFKEAEPSRVLTEISGEEVRKIIMVAAFREQKDQPTLIRAMQELPESFHLFLVGDGTCRPDCEALAGSLGLDGRVHFMGRRSDVAELLKAADYVVMSSHYEGLSLSSVEGMASGKPFLASDVDGLREVVEGAGILFPHSDHKALAASILELESSPALYARTAEACARRAEGYDISTMVRGYLRIYENIGL